MSPVSSGGISSSKSILGAGGRNRCWEAANRALGGRNPGAGRPQTRQRMLTTPAAAAPGAPGTRAVVSDLFFATPARRKFLKSPRVEADHAESAVRRLAFAAPGVAFRLESDGRVAFDLPAQDRAARVAAQLTLCRYLRRHHQGAGAERACRAACPCQES